MMLENHLSDVFNRLVVVFAKAAIADPTFVEEARAAAGRHVRALLPELIEMFRPELMPGMRLRVSGGISKVPVSRAVETLVEAWFSDPENREVTAALMIGIMKQNMAGVVELMQRGLKRYAKKVDISPFGIDLAEAMEVLDWTTSARPSRVSM